MDNVWNCEVKAGLGETAKNKSVPFFSLKFSCEEMGADLCFARRIELACPYLVLLNKSVPFFCTFFALFCNI